MSKLGAFIRYHRQQRGLSQAELGQLAGDVSRASVSGWEQGTRTPEVWRLPLIASALGLPTEVFEYRLESAILSPEESSEFRDIPILALYSVLAHVDGEAEPESDCEHVQVDGGLSLRSYAIRVQSSELATERDVMPGDVLVLDPAERPADEDIVHALLDDVIVLRIYRDRGKDRNGHPAFDLYATDPEIPTRSGNSLTPIRIVAVMVEHRKRRRLSTAR